MYILMPAVSSALRTMSRTEKVPDKYGFNEWMALSGKKLGIFGQH